MKIAILMLIHEINDVQKKLIDYLSNDFDVYIHLDKKSKIDVKEFESSNVKYICKYKVYWGSFNQIMATLELFRIANSQKYDRYCFISGNDIPLMNNQEIKKFFENDTHEYFSYEILPKSDWDGNGGFDRIDFFHPNMQSRGKVNLVTKFFSKLINKINLKLVIPALKVCGIKRKKDEISFYGGPNWMDLTGTCVSQIISFIDSNPNYVKMFKYTRCADEVFFQTLILNYVKNVHLSNKLLRYIDWSSGPEYPRVLRITDYTKMKDSSCLFARKVDDRIDNEIINQIYSELKA